MFFGKINLLENRFFFLHIVFLTSKKMETQLSTFNPEIISGQSILIFSRREQKSRGAKCVLLLLINFAEISLADTRVLRWLRKLSAGDPMIYYSGSLVEKSGNLIMLPRYTGEKKKTFKESGSYFLFNDVHQQALA